MIHMKLDFQVKLLKKYVRTFLTNLNYEKLNEHNTTIDYLISELIKFSFSIDEGNEDAIIIFSKINGGRDYLFYCIV